MREYWTRRPRNDVWKLSDHPGDAFALLSHCNIVNKSQNKLLENKSGWVQCCEEIKFYETENFSRFVRVPDQLRWC
jgi:hypothetical protein